MTISVVGQKSIHHNFETLHVKLRYIRPNSLCNNLCHLYGRLTGLRYRLNVNLEDWNPYLCGWPKFVRTVAVGTGCQNSGWWSIGDQAFLLPAHTCRTLCRFVTDSATLTAFKHHLKIFLLRNQESVVCCDLVEWLLCYTGCKLSSNISKTHDTLIMYTCILWSVTCVWCIEVVSPASSGKSAAIAKVSTPISNQEAYVPYFDCIVTIWWWFCTGSN